MERLKYLDFDLKFERQGEAYVARVLRSPGGEASTVFTLPFSAEKLELLVLKLGRLRGGTRRVQSPEMEAARELGGKLFETVFGTEVRACLKSSLDEANRSAATGVRLKLRLQDTPELADLPWEFLYDPSFDRFLAQSDFTPIVRYIEIPERIQPLAVALPLRLLVMISSPADYACLDVQREKANMEKALASLTRHHYVELEWVEDATLRTLQQRLRKREYHIFHFIGHGGLDARSGEGVLVMEDERGNGWLTGAHRVATVLHDCRSLRLAVLNSCEGARNTRTDPFAGVAATLLRQGLPAVVAMQFEITDEAAITFSSELYSALASGFPIDAAVAEARKAIYLQPNDVEWGTPVLYMRSPDGVLFSLAAPAGAEHEKVVDVRPEEPAAKAEISQTKPEEERPGPGPPMAQPGAEEVVRPVGQAAEASPEPTPVFATETQKTPERFRRPHRVVMLLSVLLVLIAAIVIGWLWIGPGSGPIPKPTPKPVPTPQPTSVLRVEETAEQCFARAEQYERNRDYRDAAEWYRRAADQGHLEAGYKLGLLVLSGREGVKQNLQEGLERVQTAAAKGYPDAAVTLGRMYLKGEGVPRDPYEADRWFVKANQKGSAAEQFELGQLYESGTDAIKPNLDKAEDWYRAAAGQGYKPAQEAVRRLRAGWDAATRPVARPTSESRSEETAEQCFARAEQYDRNGNYRDAVEWYRKAADRGHLEAAYRLGLLLLSGREGGKQNLQEGFERMKSAAEKGYPDAQVTLGRMYLNGEGVPRDPYEADRWFMFSNQRGSAADQFELGRLYEEGTEAIKPNMQKAEDWYRMAAGQGHKTAQEALDRLKANAMPIPGKPPEPSKSGPAGSPKRWKVSRRSFTTPLSPKSKGYYYDFDAHEQPSENAPGVDFVFVLARRGSMSVVPRNGAKFAPFSTETPPWDLKQSSFITETATVQPGMPMPCITTEGRYCTFTVQLGKGEFSVSYDLYDSR